MAHCTTLLIHVTLGKQLQISGKKGYVQKWHLRYKTSNISETKQSRAKLTIECLRYVVLWLEVVF